MIRCHRAYNFGRYQEVRILHISTYLEGVCPEMHKIIEHMKGGGFRVERCRYRHSNLWIHPNCSNSDVLLFGCDSNEVEKVREVLCEVDRGLFGIWKWDILWYFADGRVSSYARQHYGVDYCSNDEFSDDAISMINTHVQRRNDSTAQAGLPIKLANLLESSIDNILVSKKYDTLGTRLKRLKKRAAKFKGRRDWELFIATANFLVTARNYYSHVNQTSTKDSMLEEWENFKEAAQRHGFGLPSIMYKGSAISSREDNHGRLKLLIFLTRIAKAWLDECDKSIW